MRTNNAEVLRLSIQPWVAHHNKEAIFSMSLQKSHHARLALPTLRPRGRPKVMTDSTQRESIIAGARALFLKNGYGRTTTGEIAAKCRISKQTLYRLFPSKQGLFVAIVEAHRQSMLAIPEKSDDLSLDDALERIFRIDIDPKEDAERIALLRLVTIEAQQFPELKDILHQYGGARSHAELARWLSGLKRRRLIQIDDAGSAAHILMDMIFGTIIFKPIHHHEILGAKSRKIHIRRCIRIFLDGVKARRS